MQTDPQIAEIAAAMSEAERQAMLFPQDRLSTNDLVDFALADRGLKRPVYCPAEQRYGHVHTRKGQSVAAYLKEQSNAD
jgi:hypothetical protein